MDIFGHDLVTELDYMFLRVVSAFTLFIGLSVVESSFSQTSSGTALKPQDTLDLRYVVDEIMSKNARVSSSSKMVNAARRRASSVGSWSDPMLMLGLENVPTSFDLDMDPMTMKTVGLSWELPYQGTRGLNRRAALAQVESAVAESAMVTLNIVTEGLLAYFELEYWQTYVQRLESTVELYDQIIAAANSRYVANLAGQDEVLSAQVEKWRTEADLKVFYQQRLESMRRLNAFRGLEDVNSTIAVRSTPLLERFGSDDSLFAAIDNNPELAVLVGETDFYRYSSLAAGRMSWPMIEIESEYGYRSGSDINHLGDFMERDDMISFGLNISLPIFSGRAESRMASSMQLMSESSLARLTQRRRELRAEALSIRDKERALRESLELYEERIVPAANDALDASLARYRSNQSPLTSVLQQAVTVQNHGLMLDKLRLEAAMASLELAMLTNQLPIER